MVVKLQNGNFLNEKINHSVTSFQPTEPALSLKVTCCRTLHQKKVVKKKKKKPGEQILIINLDSALLTEILPQVVLCQECTSVRAHNKVNRFQPGNQPDDKCKICSQEISKLVCVKIRTVFN